MLILGIESSCDETAAAIVRGGDQILSSVVASQIGLHRPWGGVVPELASREHLEKVDPVVQKAVSDSGIRLPEIDAIAVTQGPGLIGSLLVGVCYAKSLAYALQIPLVGVNHIEGHVYSVAFDHPPVAYPALALIVSGGHTNIFYVPSEGRYRIVSRTRDDAAGEAFDKVAKMLGLGYPGGPAIEKLAESGDPRKVKFKVAKISDGRPDMSFSGLKTAVARFIRENGIESVAADSEPVQIVRDLSASFQRAVVEALMGTMERLASEFSPSTLIVAGGVSCNLALQKSAIELGRKLSTPVYIPSRHLSTDNAAMIAAAGYFQLQDSPHENLGLTADISLRLQNLDNEEAALRKDNVRYRL
jgi:N6-L-threonylcarbamoyladenine synthase